MIKIKDMFSKAFWDRFSKEVVATVQNQNCDCNGFRCDDCKSCTCDSDTGDMIEVVTCFECQCRHHGCKGCAKYGTDECDYE